MTMDTTDNVAHLLREKVRSNAFDLLNRLESMEKKRTIVPTTSPEKSNGWFKTDENKDRRSSLATALAASRSPSSVGSLTPPPETTTTTMTPATHSLSTNTLPATAPIPLNPAQSSLELSRRLQQLAFDREKQHDTTLRLRVIQADAASHLHSAKTFEELSLPDYLLRAIYQMGFDRPSCIQAESLPRILNGRNLIAQAQSGSGKTAAFTIGLLYCCDATVPATDRPHALCVTPTREIAIQIVEKAITPLASNMKNLKVKLAISGEHVERGEKIKAHLIVGTPGKVVDWLKRKLIDPRDVKMFVLDEADNMVQQKSVGGFRANTFLIRKQLKKDCQCLLFSATYSPEVIHYCNRLVQRADKILIEDGPEYLMLNEINQLWIDTREYEPEGSKILFLADIYNLMTIGQSIVFVSAREEADLVFETLSNAGYSCAVLHSGMTVRERDETMLLFRAGRSTVLITTNVLARGVDIDNVCLVVNYNIPVYTNTLLSGEPDYETYLHRIGRTGRFGRKGTAVNLVGDDKQMDALSDIVKHFFSAPDGLLDPKCRLRKIEADPEALAAAIEF